MDAFLGWSSTNTEREPMKHIYEVALHIQIEANDAEMAFSEVRSHYAISSPTKRFVEFEVGEPTKLIEPPQC